MIQLSVIETIEHDICESKKTNFNHMLSALNKYCFTPPLELHLIKVSNGILPLNWISAINYKIWKRLAMNALLRNTIDGKMKREQSHIFLLPCGSIIWLRQKTDDIIDFDLQGVFDIRKHKTGLQPTEKGDRCFSF